MMGALSALLEGSVASAVEAADFLGLTTAMIVEGLGLSEDQWYFDDYEKCLLNVSSWVLVTVVGLALLM